MELVDQQELGWELAHVLELALDDAEQLQLELDAPHAQERELALVEELELVVPQFSPLDMALAQAVQQELEHIGEQSVRRDKVEELALGLPLHEVGELEQDDGQSARQGKDVELVGLLRMVVEPELDMAHPLELELELEHIVELVAPQSSQLRLAQVDEQCAPGKLGMGVGELQDKGVELGDPRSAPLELELERVAQQDMVGVVEQKPEQGKVVERHMAEEHQQGEELARQLFG